MIETVVVDPTMRAAVLFDGDNVAEVHTELRKSETPDFYEVLGVREDGSLRLREAGSRGREELVVPPGTWLVGRPYRGPRPLGRLVPPVQLVDDTSYREKFLRLPG